MVPYFSFQVNTKLDVGVQSVTMIIVYGAKRVLEKFMGQNVIRGIALGGKVYFSLKFTRAHQLLKQHV